MRGCTDAWAVPAAALRPVARAAAIGLLLLGIVVMHQVPLPHGGSIGTDGGAGHASASDQRGGHDDRFGIHGDAVRHGDSGTVEHHGNSGAEHQLLHLCLAILIALGLGLLRLWRRPIRVLRTALARPRTSGVSGTRDPPPPAPDPYALRILRL